MEKFLGSTLFFVIMLAFGCAGSFLDYHSSTKFFTHGLAEANPLNRDDETGYFSGRKFWTWHIPLLAVPVALFPFTGGWSGFFYTLVGAISAFQAIKNYRAAKRSREFQINFLRKLRELSEGDDRIGQLFNQLLFRSQNGLTYFGKFPWIVSRRPNEWEALAELVGAIVRLSREPETEWFKR